MALVLVNLDNPTQTSPLDARENADALARGLGWRENAYAIIEHADAEFLANLTGALDREIAQAAARVGDVTPAETDMVTRGDQSTAVLVKDGYVYEVAVDEENVTVTGRESSIACPRDALDGE